MTELPSYSELPPAPEGGRSGWGVFGADDNLGLVNLMTPERIAAAARLVTKGQVFPLDMPLGSVDPGLARYRGVPRHRVLHRAGTSGFDDVYDNFYPQASSQWDSLAHVGYAHDQFYNGVTEADVWPAAQHHRALGAARHRRPRGRAGRRVGPCAPPGATTSPASHRARRSMTWSWPGGRPARVRAGRHRSCCAPASRAGTSSSRWRPGWRCTGTSSRPASSRPTPCAEYLWNSHATAIASDNFAVEVVARCRPGVPAPDPDRPVRDGPRGAVVAR